MTPEELLRTCEEIGTCEDAQLLEERWGIKDNFLVLLYGGQLHLFKTVFEAFLNSPEQKGLHDRWLIRDTEARARRILEYLGKGEISSNPTFDYEPGTASVAIHTRELSEPRYCHDGQPTTLWLSFHPDNQKKMPGVDPRVGLARGISDFVQYAAHNDITSRLLRYEETIKR